MENLTVNEKIDRINERLDKLFTAILGDNKFGSTGYRQRIEDNEQTLYDHRVRMDKIDNRFEKVYQRVMGMCVGITIATSIAGWWIQNSIQVVKASSVPRINRIYSPSLSRKMPPVTLQYADSLGADSANKNEHKK